MRMSGVVDFEQWYRANHSRLLNAMTVLCGTLDEASEVVDEASARCLQRWDAGKPLDDPTAWTYRVAVNLARRRAWRQGRERSALEMLNLPASVSIAEPAVELWREVARLPRRQRTAVSLRYLGGLTEAQVAEAMGVAAGTVAATLSAARRRLAARLHIDEESHHVS
jgi:RNA polymerase sigma factor (sigma-70 family)